LALTTPPAQAGTGWAYGLRVISTLEEDIADRRSVSSRSASSTSPYKDYEIWRRWDDCLWFQETLELEYSIQAREKRRRLEQGKGVKKNGVYVDSKRAASFESLPPGPDPTSVSLDIHNYIPKLTKKATLFRANQATIDQRQQQFATLVEALLAPEVPALIGELRASSAVRDFFGWWRRDKDFARKHGPGKGKNPEIPILDSVPFYLDVSDSSQIFSSPQTRSRDLPQHRSKPARRTTADPTSSDSIRHSPRSYSRDNALSRRRTTPAPTPPGPAIAVSHAPTNDMHDSRPSSRGSVYSVTSDELSPTVVMWDGQEQLSSDRISPNTILNAFPQTPMVRETFENIQCPPSPDADSPVLGLEALPEVPDLELSLSQTSAYGHEYETRPPVTKSRGKDGRHRRAVVYPPEVALGEEVPEIPERSPTTTNTTESSRDSSLFSSRSLAPSWRTSASDLPPLSSPRHSMDSTDAIDYSSTGSPVTPHTPWLPEAEALPAPGSAAKRNPRESIMTIDSIMSDTSVDQVLPRGVYMTPQPGDVSLMRTFSVGPRSRPHIFVPMSVPEEEVSPEDCDDVTLDSYLFGTCHAHHIQFWRLLHSISSHVGFRTFCLPHVLQASRKWTLLAIQKVKLTVHIGNARPSTQPRNNCPSHSKTVRQNNSTSRGYLPPRPPLISLRTSRMVSSRQ